MKKYKVHIIWAVIVIVALVGGIFYGKSSVPAEPQTVRRLPRAARGGTFTRPAASVPWGRSSRSIRAAAA